MLPHINGEHNSIFSAFHECSLALHKFDKSQLDDNATLWIKKLESLMDVTGISDPHGEGLFLVKAKQLSIEEKIELSHIIDELASWFVYSD
jgi:hypothetical protein